MTLEENVRRMICDGANCAEIADALVAFHPELLKTADSDSTAESWLYEIRLGVTLHFCPTCARKRLKQINGISV